MRLKGKRTYLTLAILLMHHILRDFFGIDIPHEDLSKAIDVFLILLAGFFRFLATRK